MVDASVLAGIGAGLDDIYLRNPALLENFALELAQATDTTNSFRFDVASAVYDSTTLPEQLRLTVAS